jgi:hypothetical protein
MYDPRWVREIAAVTTGAPFHGLDEGVRRFRRLASLLHKGEVGDERLTRVSECLWNIRQRLDELGSKAAQDRAMRLASESNVRHVTAIDTRLLGTALDREDLLQRCWTTMSK